MGWSCLFFNCYWGWVIKICAITREWLCFLIEQVFISYCPLPILYNQPLIQHSLHWTVHQKAFSCLCRQVCFEGCSYSISNKYFLQHFLLSKLVGPRNLGTTTTLYYTGTCLFLFSALIYLFFLNLIIFHH